MKLFEINSPDVNEKTLVAAHENIGAIKVYCEEYFGSDISYLGDDEYIVDVPEEEWKSRTIINPDFDKEDPDDWYERSLEDHMRGITIPTLIGATNDE